LSPLSFWLGDGAVGALFLRNYAASSKKQALAESAYIPTKLRSSRRGSAGGRGGGSLARGCGPHFAEDKCR
jgi:hypothetical protein